MAKATEKKEGEQDVAKDQLLPPLKDGEMAQVVDVRVLEKKTNPPKRYTEGILIEDMKNAGKYVEDPKLRAVLKEVSGLGTSATRDSIIETLKSHKYLQVSGKHIVPTEKGEALITWLDLHCPELTDIALTARWEAELDAVAKKGGGAGFETVIAQKIRDIVTTLRQAAPIPGGQSTERNKMNDGTSSEPRAGGGKPTAKMLEYARKIAEKLGQPFNEELSEDFAKCSAFINENKDAANRPSEKQLSFARRIAEDKKATIPEEALKDGRMLSRWIDDNKSK